MPVLAALAAACALAAASAQASDETAPVAQTLAPTGFAGVVVVLHGAADPGRQRTTVWFEIGPTTAYGSTTQPVTIDNDHPVPVNSVVTGLLKGTTYHARLVARNSDGVSQGADVSFTLGVPNAANGSAPPAGDDTGAGNDPGSARRPTSTPATRRRRLCSRRPPRPSSARPWLSPCAPATCSSACPAPRAPWR